MATVKIWSLPFGAGGDALRNFRGVRCSDGELFAVIAHVCVCLCTCVRTCMRACVHACVRVHVCLCVSVDISHGWIAKSIMRLEMTKLCHILIYLASGHHPLK